MKLVYPRKQDRLFSEKYFDIKCLSTLNNKMPGSVATLLTRSNIVICSRKRRSFLKLDKWILEFKEINGYLPYLSKNNNEAAQWDCWLRSKINKGLKAYLEQNYDYTPPHLKKRKDRFKQIKLDIALFIAKNKRVPTCNEISRKDRLIIKAETGLTFLQFLETI